MAANRGSGAVKVQYRFVDGAHFFTSDEVKGLCAASPDLLTAYKAVGVQLGVLLDRGAFEPSVPAEAFRDSGARHAAFRAR